MNHVNYQLPLANSAEIGLIRDALDQYRQNNEEQEERTKPILNKIELLFSIAATEEQYNDLTSKFRAMTGCEPDDL